MCDVQIEVGNGDGKPIPGKERKKQEVTSMERDGRVYIPKGSPLVVVITAEEYRRVPGTQSMVLIILPGNKWL